MARIPDELRSTFYDRSNNSNFKEIKRAKFKVRNRQPIFSRPISDTPINPNHDAIFAQNVDKQENIFVKIKRYINKKRSHNN